MIKKGSVLVVQAPFTTKRIIPTRRKYEKIVIIHDIEGLRSGSNRILLKETQFYNSFEKIIVHNERMKEYLTDHGIDNNKMIAIEFFDYLCNSNNIKEVNNIKVGQNINVVYMGNLSYKKAPFLRQLESERMKFKINAYGNDGDDIQNGNIYLKGSLLPDDAPSNIIGDFGLVWDGNIDESDEYVGAKNYTKYNNPHKLSCYLAAGLPVIVWEKAAIAAAGVAVVALIIVLLTVLRKKN